jgi:hypothetical protein
LPSHDEAQLANAVQNFARLGHAVHSFAPAVRIVSGFYAVVPRQPAAAIDALAASCTTIFDAYRAPMTPQERARRIALKLNDEQRRNLNRWGNPYVLSQYQFHMTLTGKVAPGRRKAILAILQQSLHRMGVERSVAVDRLALVKQETPDAAFRVVTDAAIGASR